MRARASGETLFFRDEGRRARATGLPPDVVAQSARRLRILALLYAFTFFMAAYVPNLLDPVDRARHFAGFVHWGPGAIAIAISLLVAALATHPRVPLSRVGVLAFTFEVVSSYGIAAAEFLGASGISFDVSWVGLSWVAVWVLLFAVVVPSPPRRTVVATLLSLSAVPVMVGFVVATRDVPGVTAPRF